MKKTAIAIALAVASTVVYADDFTETLDNARQAYEEGDINGAKEELEYATQLLGQMRSKELQSFLPEALDGWERKDAEDSKASNGGLAMLGGGTTAEATYKQGNRQKVMVKKNSLMTMINKRIIVEVKGRSSMEAKEAYFKQINFKGLKAF